VDILIKHDNFGYLMGIDLLENHKINLTNKQRDSVINFILKHGGRDYVWELAKAPNLSEENIKNIMENRDFTVLAGKNLLNNSKINLTKKQKNSILKYIKK
jgi:uncharacterized protein